MKKLLIFLLFSNTTYAITLDCRETLNVCPQPVHQPQHKHKPKPVYVSRLIKVYPSALTSAQEWCKTQGGLAYIEVDSLNNEIRGSWRYVCKGDK